MKTIQLTQGQVALVDDEDYEILSQLKWSAHKQKNNYYAISSCYCYLTKKRHHLIMHRVIMGCKKGKEIDHIDHNGLNNQKCNLRFATRSQNQQNRRPTNKSLSAYKGVCWNKKVNKWQADITLSGKLIRIGFYDTEIKAAQAYNEKAKELFGEYAYINTIQYNF